MRTRRRIALFIAFVVAVAALFWLLSPHDLIYQGVPLNRWLKDLHDTKSWDRRLAAEQAIWDMGTNTIPYLLPVFDERDSGFKIKMVEWLEKRRIADWNYMLASERQLAIVEAFGVLGPKARSALGQLGEIAHGPGQATSAIALWAIAVTRLEDAGPAIAVGLTNGLAGSRTTAVFLARYLGAHGRCLVPALAGALSDSNHMIRRNAAIALRDIGLEPNTAVPALTACLTDTAPIVVSVSAGALASFGTNAEPAHAALRLATSNSEPHVSRVASNVLFCIECEVRDGAIIRGPKAEHKLALVFTAHEYAEGAETILAELSEHCAKASFFLTGAFLTNRSLSSLVQRMRREGHLVGPHSDQHLLYCSWENPQQTLVARHEFRRDLVLNLQKLGASPPQQWLHGGAPVTPAMQSYFLPAYEHYNRDIADWTRELGQTLINFTPGTLSTADYTCEADRNFVSSQAIFDSIVAREQQDPHGLNGYLLLLHLGAGPGRADKFHYRFGELLDFLSGKGYQLVRVDELLDPVLARIGNSEKSK